jgi:uncharacterized glyoxalase superfamily protein PhnB
MGTISATLAVRDMKRTLEFYQDSLGFKIGMVFPGMDNPEYADVSKDGMVLMFLPITNIGIDDEEKLGTGVNFYLNIDGDIDQYYQELNNKDVKIASDIKDEPYGIRDFGGGNPENIYCANCSNADGRLKSREEVYQGMISFMVATQNMDKQTAKVAARDYMSKMPAWS